MRVNGPSIVELDRLGDQYAAKVTGAMRRVLRQTVDRAAGHYDIGALTVIPTLWTQLVHDGGLLRELALGYWVGVNATYRPVARALTAAAGDDATDPGPPAGTPDVPMPRVTSSAAEQYLAIASNRLVGIGDDIWQYVRANLLDGVHSGEGVTQLADRIIGAGGLAQPRVEVIARTEVNGAANAGSIAQVRALRMTADKTWMAAHDERTRPEHALADGQTVPLDQPFIVGGERMDRPHDPNGSAGNVVNCRCTLAYDLADDELPALTAAAHQEDVMTDTLDDTHAHTEDCGCELTAETLAGKPAPMPMPMPKNGKCPPGMSPDGNGMCVKAASDEPVRLDAADYIELGGRPNPGTKPDKRLKANKKAAAAGLTEALADAPDPGTAPQWRGPLIVEGKETGDRREFSPGAIDWPDPQDVPLILQWQKETSHGGEHDVTVSVGRIDRVWRDGELIMGEGRYDTHPDAVEYQRRVVNGMAGGISVNADDIADEEVEVIYDKPENGEDEGDLFSMLFARPKKIIYHGGRLRGATGCDIPAFVEARIAAVDTAEPTPNAVPALFAHAHETDTSPDEWDAELHASRLRPVMSREHATQAFAWVGSTDEQVPADAGRLLHHEIDPSGDPLAASLSACLQGIMQLHDLDIPESDRRAVHRHLAAHLSDAGIRAPMYEPEQALLAHAWQDDLWRPPREWFNDPKLTVPAPITVTDAGQVFGLAAEWRECHIGIGGRCVPPPRETYHDRFMCGTITCADGSEVPVGQITAGIGHAPTRGISANQAAEHYDNTTAVVADVAVGNCRLGIWVAGAIRPWAETQRVEALKRSGQVSPDWREIGGRLRLVGLLTVNTSGYQVPRMRAVVAGGRIRTLIASGFTSVHREPSIDEARRAAERAELRRIQDDLRAQISA